MDCFPEHCGRSGLQPSPRQRPKGGLLRSNATIARHVHELITALDARRRQPLRADEEGIAVAAAALRLRALERLAELEGAPEPAPETQADGLPPGDPTRR